MQLNNLDKHGTFNVFDTQEYCMISACINIQTQKDAIL